MTSTTIATEWRLGDGRALSLDRPQLMGIVNATPDSFSDGRPAAAVEAIVGHGLRLVEEGASILDVGGESTRPGATRIGVGEQVDRTVPVIEELRRCVDVPISIDTTRAEVAAAALDAGAMIVNDVSAGLEDTGLLPLAAARGAGVILMHRRLPPEEDSYSDRYEQDPEDDDILGTVRAYLDARCAAAMAAGVARSSIVVDPGLGFGKSVEQNFELIRRMPELALLGFPILGAASRKSFIGHATGVREPRDRAVGSVAIAVYQFLAGVRLFRVHDVAIHREALAAVDAIGAALPDPA